jgi:hypothetical protein
MSDTADRPSVLQATARNRVVVAYAVAPDRVASRLPEGLMPDTREGQAFVTLVGVQLVTLRVLGLPGPGFRRVPAVELQVLVRERGAPSRQGTITVQAHVPRRVVAWGARLLYDESVDVAPMQPVWRERGDTVEMTYRFDVAGREQRLRVVGERPPVTPAQDTAAHFLLDRGWRYGRGNEELVRTRVERPVAPVVRARESYATVQWAAVYGDPWAFLAEEEPALAVLVPDSPITLRWRERVA